MELLYNSTKRFEKDMADLQTVDRQRVIKAVNGYGEAVLANPQCRYPHVYRTHIPILSKGLESTLYTLKIGRDIRVVLTVDDDPLFDQLIIGLLGVVRHRDLEKAFRGIAQSLYQSQLESIRSSEVGHG